MRNKDLFVLVTLATMLCSGILVSTVTAQEETPSGTVDPSAVPQDGLIAPAPEDNSTTSDDGPIYYSADDNRTLADDTGVIDSEQGPLVTTVTPDNTLAFIAIGIISLVAIAGIVGAFHYRRKISNQ